MIIDAHLHVFVARSERYPRDVHELFPADLEAPVEEYIGWMDRTGVDRAVLVPLTAHDDYVAEVVGRYAPRFAWVGVMDTTVDDPIADLERRADDTGMRGLRIYGLGDPDVADVRELAIFPLLEAMRDRGDIVWFYAAPKQQALLVRVMEQLPDLTVMLNHLGFCQQGYEKDQYGRPRIRTPLPPATLENVRQLAAYPEVYALFSGQYAFSQQEYPHLDLRPTVHAVLDALGPHRLTWASDYPWITQHPGYSEQLDLPRMLLPELSDDDHRAIMGGNAARLFGFDDMPRGGTA